MRNNMARRSIRVSLAATSSLLIAVMGSGFAAGNVAKPPKTTIPKLHWKGTITMYAGVYTPTLLGGQKVVKGMIKLTALDTLAKQFETMYPGIKIHFIPGALANPQIETKAAGGEMYDIYENQYYAWNAVFAPGIAYNLNPYFNEPNPYMPGNKAWKDVMDTAVLEQSAAPDGQHYDVDADWVGTAFYYNKNLFAKADIVKPPKTWTQLINDEKQLTKHHIIAGAHVPSSYSWWSRLFLGNNITGTTLAKLLAYSKNKYAVSALGEVIGYKTGIFNPATNPRIMAWWPLVKELYSYWDKDVTDLPWDDVLPGSQTGTLLFAAGKSAMDYAGSWFPRTLASSRAASLGIGSFAFPASSLAKVYPYGTATNSTADVGGPSGAFQYGISTPRADQSMNQPGKFQAVLDWLRFISTPEHSQEVINQLGEYIPTFHGTKPVASAIGAVLPKDAKYVSIFGFSDVSAEAHTEIGNMFQEYLEGDISFATAKQEFDSDVAQAVQQYIATYHPHIP